MSPPLLTITIILIIIISECVIVNSFEPDFFELGTINYGHLISRQNWIRKKEEDKMKYAMEHIGFMVLTNHGISKYIMDNVWNETRKFFDSSIDNKESVLMTKDYIYGYSADERLDLSEKIKYFKGKDSDSTPSSRAVDQKEMFAGNSLYSLLIIINKWFIYHINTNIYNNYSMDRCTKYRSSR